MNFPVRISIRLNDGPQLWLSVEIGEGYPRGQVEKEKEDLVHEDAMELKDLRLDLSGPQVKRDELDDLNSFLKRRVGQSLAEGVENVIFDTYTALQERLLEQPLTSTGRDTHKVDDGKHDSSLPVKVQDDIEMARVIFWTHHLKATSKRKDMAAWCSELDLWGIVKLGYPGFLCFEGTSSDVDEMVRRIKSLQWHALSVRYHEHYTFERRRQGEVRHTSKDGNDLVSAALSACLLSEGHASNVQGGSLEGRKIRTGCEEVESVKTLVERLTRSGMDRDQLVEALNLRTAKERSA
ncbi:hypothetical protein IE53DRAFT_383371 [Violaceomyces palustris]|uniref:Uncharacterized protein n=1 Tax=Violaceomyces palustris TaxID=1673888 RepID=A0ACD0P7P7_9BASI|nr:hypothetical protein IE53DRAFT_383371 [Violaceomyces palustris]